MQCFSLNRRSSPKSGGDDDHVVAGVCPRNSDFRSELCLLRADVQFFWGNFVQRFPCLISEAERTTDTRPNVEILRLSKQFSSYIIAVREAKRRYRARAEPESVLYHALERDPLVRGRQRRPNGENTEGARGTLPDLLAADFRFYLPARISGERCTRPDPGFFCHGA